MSSLTPEQQEKLKEYDQLSIEMSKRTAPMTDDEKAGLEEHIRAFYRTLPKGSGGPEAADHTRVYIVSSPLVGLIAAGLAAWCFGGTEYDRAKGLVHIPKIPEYNGCATRDQLIYAVARACNIDVEEPPPGKPIGRGSFDHSGQMYSGTPAQYGPRNCVDGRWRSGLPDLVLLCEEFGLPRHAMEWAVREGGSMISSANVWSGPVATMKFHRDVLKRENNWDDFAPWEWLAEHSGPRFSHQEFCLVSEFPEIHEFDENGQPHNEDGPFFLWRDGARMYMIHGMRVPGWIIERPELIEIERIDAEQNAELRRVMIEKYGLERYLVDAGAEVIAEDVDEGGKTMRLLRRSITGDEDIVALHLINSTDDPDGTAREYIIRVPPDMNCVWLARNWTFGFDDADLRFDVVS